MKEKIKQKGFIPILILVGAFLLISTGVVTTIKYKDEIKSAVANISATIFNSKDTGEQETKEESTTEVTSTSTTETTSTPELIEELKKEIESLKEQPPTQIIYKEKEIIKEVSVPTPTPMPVPEPEPEPEPIESWVSLENKHFTEANQKGWASLVITNALGDKRYYRKEGTLWSRKNTEAEAGQPYIISTPTPTPAPQPDSETEELESIREFLKGMKDSSDERMTTVELLANGLQSMVSIDYSSAMMYFENGKERSGNAFTIAQNTKIDYSIPSSITSLMSDLKNAHMNSANKNKLYFEAYRLSSYYYLYATLDNGYFYLASDAYNEGNKLHDELMESLYESDAIAKALHNEFNNHYLSD